MCVCVCVCVCVVFLKGDNQEPIGEARDPGLQPIRVRTEFKYSLSQAVGTDGGS